MTNNKKSNNVILNLFSDILNNKKTKLDKLDDKLNKLIQQNIPSYTNEGQEKTTSELIFNIFNGGSNPQYSFTNNKNSKKNKELTNLFQQFNDGIYNQSARKDLYNTYRYLIKNIPQLNAAISILTENILSPDEIFKEPFQIIPINNNFKQDNELFISSTKIEAMNMNNIINSLKIDEKLYSWISNALLLGNTFIEIIDADEAVDIYLAEESLLQNTNKDLNDKYYKKEKELFNKQLEALNISEDNKIELLVENESNTPIKERIYEHQFINNVLDNDVFIIEDSNNGNKDIIKSHKNNVLNNHKIFKDFRAAIFNDYTKKELKSVKDKIKSVGRPTNLEKQKELENKGNEEYVTRLGAIILKQIKSEHVIRLSNSGFLLGYLIIKEKEMNVGVQNKVFGNIGNIIDLSQERNKNTNDKLTDLIIDKMLTKYKLEFEANGIEKEHLNNIDVKRTIASIITEKKTANLRFVAPSNMIEFINHSEFGESDYGSSVLDSCVILAKYYIALLTSYTVFNITRAPEKRVFKVEQNTNTDISASVQEVVKAVKQKEMSFKDFHKIDAIPKEITAFNDIFLPSVDGQSAVSIEAFPGQGNSIDMTYLDDIRRMIIYATKVPPSLLGDTENSYHTSASQENYKFAKTIIRYQQQFQEQVTLAIAKLYRMLSIENKGVTFNKIIFNPPAFAKLEQNASMIAQAEAISNFVVDAHGMNPETQQPYYPKLLAAKRFATFIPWDDVEQDLIKYKHDQLEKQELRKYTSKTAAENNIDNKSKNM